MQSPAGEETAIIPQSKPYCGDGICDGPENGDICPQDCFTEMHEGLTPDGESPPPLYFFYAIHVDGGWSRLDASENPDPEEVQNVIATIRGIQEVLERHSVVGTWEFVKGTGRALFEPPETNILRELDDRGHEIGVHTHQSEEIANVFNELHEMCGIEARTISGFLLDTDNAGLEGAQQAVSYDILISLQFGDSLPTSLSTCLV